MSAAVAPYSKLKDSGIPWLGMVPAHWEVCRLRTSVHGCVNGIWGTEPNGSDDITCVRVADFDRTLFRVNIDQPTTRSVSAAERRGRVLTSGDLLLEKSGGGDLQPVGAVMLYTHALSAVCSNFIGRMPVVEDHDSRYLSYLHSHLYSIGLNTRSIKQTTGIQNLDSNSYLGERVTFAPLGEQRDIARFLDHADRRIQRYIRAKERLIELLEEQKQAIIHQAVTGQIDVRTGQPYPAYKDAGVEWLGEVPEHWELVPLKWLSIRSQNGATPPTSEPVFYKNGTVPWYGPSSCGTAEEIGRPVRRLNQTAFSRGVARIVCGPAVLFVVIGATAGRMALMFGEGSTNQQITAFELDSRLVRPRFILRQVRQAENWLRSTASSATIPILASNVVDRLECAIPPLAEQDSINQFLRSRVELIDQSSACAGQQIDLLGEYRTRLIADVVTGKLDVREATASLPETDPLTADDPSDNPEIQVTTQGDIPNPASPHP